MKVIFTPASLKQVRISSVRGEVGAPVVLGLAPGVDQILDAALAVAGHHDGRRRIVQHLVAAAGGLQHGAADVLHGGVVGGGDGDLHTAAAQTGVVDDLLTGQGAVGQHDPLAGGAVQGGVGQVDLLHGAVAAAGGDEVAQGEGVGGQDHQAAGHVGQHGLNGQGHRQGQDAQQRHQGGDGDTQPVSHDQQRDHQQEDLHGGGDIAGHPGVQLAALQDPAQDRHDDLDDDQADHQSDQGVNQRRQVEGTEKAFGFLRFGSGGGKQIHGNALLFNLLLLL